MAPTGESSDLDEGPGMPKDLDTPEQLALTDEIYHVVNAAIEQLCEEQRGAIVLRELEGLSYAEVASRMSCPIGTVRSRVFRAREAIDIQLRRVFDHGLSRVYRVPLRRCCESWRWRHRPDRLALTRDPADGHGPGQ